MTSMDPMATVKPVVGSASKPARKREKIERGGSRLAKWYLWTPAVIHPVPIPLDSESTFRRKRQEWHGLILRDQMLAPVTALVALYIAQCVNWEKGGSWPS